MHAPWKHGKTPLKADMRLERTLDECFSCFWSPRLHLTPCRKQIICFTLFHWHITPTEFWCWILQNQLYYPGAHTFHLWGFKDWQICLSFLPSGSKEGAFIYFFFCLQRRLLTLSSFFFALFKNNSIIMHPDAKKPGATKQTKHLNPQKTWT